MEIGETTQKLRSQLAWSTQHSTKHAHSLSKTTYHIYPQNGLHCFLSRLLKDKGEGGDNTYIILKRKRNSENTDFHLLKSHKERGNPASGPIPKARYSSQIETFRGKKAKLLLQKYNTTS